MLIDPEMFQALYHAKLQELKFRISDYDIAKFRNRGCKDNCEIENWFSKLVF
jgi:hypothetical protein